MTKANARGWNRVMRWVRRLHLYSGLFMLPWVILYGATALLFNHPTYFADRGTVAFGPAASEKEPFGDLPTAETMAREIVEQLNRPNEESGGSSRYRLAPSQYAEFTRAAFASVTGEDAEYTIVLTGTDGSGFVLVKPLATTADQPLARKVTPPSLDELKEKLAAGLRRKLREMGVKQDGAFFRALPELQFDLQVDGEVHRVRYKTMQGSLAVVEPSSMRRFLLRLHTAHTYPREPNTRWFWALVGDAMFVTMVFWGLSGMLMWWQLKRTRLLGAMFLMASAIFATWLAIAMHGVLAG